MGNFWTTDKVLELSPDSASVKAAKGLTSLSKWSDLGYSDRAVWGQCKGSGKKPYQTRIDLNGPAFKCSCPSRKFPCKHSLALFLLYANETKAFADTAAPGWVSEWLDGRDHRTEIKEQKAKEASKPPDPEAQAKRIAQREKKIRSGLDEISLWLGDMLRQGLAWAHSQSYSYWNDMAARMVDAQVSGLSGRIKKMAEVSMGDPGWQDTLTAEIGKLYMLIKAYRNIEIFDEDLQADIRSLVGWNVPKEQVLEAESINDTWAVLAQQVEQQDNLKIQRTWLFGKETNRYALILDFAAGNAVLEKTLITGTQIEAELVFYPGSFPLRALIKSRKDNPVIVEAIQSDNNIDMLIESFSGQLAMNPWTESVPAMLGPVRLLPESSLPGNEDVWQLVDSANKCIKISPDFKQGWHILSVSGGDSISMFGLWDGNYFAPLSLFYGSKYYSAVDNPIIGLRGVG